MPNFASFAFTNHFLTSFIITLIFILSICPCESVWQSERIRPLSTSAPLAYHRIHLKSRIEATTATFDATTHATPTTSAAAVTTTTTTTKSTTARAETEAPLIQIVNLSNFSNAPTIHHKKNADHLLESDVVSNNKVSTHGNQSPENKKKHHVSTGSYVNPLPAVRPRAPPPPPPLPVTTIATATRASATTTTTKAPGTTTTTATRTSTKAATASGTSSTWTSTSTLSPASVDYIGDPASPFMADLDDGVEYTYAEDSNEPLGSLSSLRSPSAASSPSSSSSSPSQTGGERGSASSYSSSSSAFSSSVSLAARPTTTTESPPGALEFAREAELESESESEINEPITLVPIDDAAAAEAVTSADDHELDVDEGANTGTGKDDESISPPAPISAFAQGDTNGHLNGPNEEHQGSHRRTPSTGSSSPASSSPSSSSSSSFSSSSDSTFTSTRVASAVAIRERKNRKEKRINSSRSSNNDQPGDGSDDQLEREESEASNTQASRRRKVKSSVSSGGSRARPTLRYLSAPLSDGRTSILIPLPQDLDEKTGVVFVEDIREGDLSKRTFRTHIFRPSQTSPISITLKPAITGARGSRTRGARHSSSSSSRGTSSSRINSLVKSIEPREPVAHARQTLTTLTVEDKLLGPSILSTNGRSSSSSSNGNGNTDSAHDTNDHSFTSDNLLSDHNSERLIVSTTTTDTPRLSPSPLNSAAASPNSGGRSGPSGAASASTTAKPLLSSSLSTGDAGDEVTRNSDSNPLSRGASRAMGSRRIPIKKLVASALKEEENSLHRSTTSTSTSTSTAAPASSWSSQRPKASSMSAALTVSRAIDRIRPRTRVPSQPPVPPAPIRIVLSTPGPNVTHPQLTDTLTHSSPKKPLGQLSALVASEEVTTGNPSSLEVAIENGQTDPPLEVEELSTTTQAPPSTTPSDLFTETTTWVGRVIHSHNGNNDPKNDLSLPSPFFVPEMRRKLTATRAPDTRMSTLREPATTRDPVSSFSPSATSAPITTVPKWIAPVVETGSNRPRPGATSGGGRSGSRRANQITILTVTSDFSSFPSRVKVSDANVNDATTTTAPATTTTSMTSAPVTIRTTSTSRESSESFSSTTRRMAPSPPSTTPGPSGFSGTRTTARRNFVSNVTTSSAPVIPVISNSDAEFNSDSENSDNIPLNVIGVPGVDYPVYHDIPLTNFDCRNVEYPGFYADLETGCQVYHSCGSRGGRRHSFICPNGTIFSQEYLICDWWFNVRCLDSHNYFSLNKEAFSSSVRSNGGPSTTSTTTTSTTESPLIRSTTLTPNDFGNNNNHTEISENESEEHVVSIADSASVEGNESAADVGIDESGVNTSIEDSSEEIIDSEVEVVSPAVLSRSPSFASSTTSTTTTPVSTTTRAATTEAAAATTVTTNASNIRRRNNGPLGRRSNQQQQQRQQQQQQQQQSSTRNSISGIGRSANNRNQLGN